MDLIAVVISGLAGWRIANLLLFEDGPWTLFERFRQLVGVKDGLVAGFFPTLFTCIYCLSVWTTLGAYLIYVVFPEAAIVIAATSVALITDKLARS